MVSTRAAWLGAQEVVEVGYRPDELSFAALLEHAQAGGCAQQVYATTAAQLQLAHASVGQPAELLEGELRPATTDDQLYYLGRSPLRFVPLTPGQARRVNSELGRKHGAPESWLSPRQVVLARRIETALRKDEHALDGLTRPTDIEHLDEFALTLSQRLASAEKSR